MKKIILAVLLAPSFAVAGPYFRLLDMSHPSPVAGALIDPMQDLKQTEAASLLPLITHSPKDGCLLPSIVCEDWTPLAVGGSMIAGHLTLDVAPLLNVLPWLQSAALALTPAKWQGVANILKPADSSVTFSAGPVWQYRQDTNRGYLKIFTGMALHF